MKRATLLAMIAACVVLAPAGAADAADCRAKMTGIGEGYGLFAGATQQAQAAATAEWQTKVASRHGKRFAAMDKAGSVRWDCTPNPVAKANCTVTARPCR